MIYYNTTSFTEDQLRSYINNAENQDKAIYRVIKFYGRKKMSPSDVASYFPKWPITSIRRSMNTLMKIGLIEKLEETKIGIYGRPEHLFKLS